MASFEALAGIQHALGALVNKLTELGARSV
jgi:hypothetical protein